MAKPQKTRIVLFVYGGGMRGIVAAHILSRIEARTGLAMADMVDIFTGPSTGSILNAALVVPATDYPVWHPSARPRFKAEHMVRFYEREGLRIFPHDRFRSFRGFVHDMNNRTVKLGKIETMFKRGHYDPSRLAQALRRLYGETSLNQTLRSLIIPVFNIDGGAASNNGLPGFFNRCGEALWLRHIEGSLEPQANMDVKLYDAVLGSCAAPTFFPCHAFDIRVPGESSPLSCAGVDGSVFDSPPVTWHGAVRPYIQSDERVVMILVGTGYTGRSFKKEEWNRLGGLGIVDPRNDLPLINILFQAPELAMMEGFAREIGEDNLFVFNRSLQADRNGPDTPSIQIDDASPENLSKMERFADLILEENAAQLDKLCDILVQGRDGQVENKKTIWKQMRKRLFYQRRSQVQ